MFKENLNHLKGVVMSPRLELPEFRIIFEKVVEVLIRVHRVRAG